MNDELLKLFKENKYKEIEKVIKKEIESNSDSAENYYYLFLASNNDYANIDFDNLSNIIYFNKALELAPRKNRHLFDSEYNMYKNASSIVRKLLCYAFRENIENYSNIVNSDDKNYSINDSESFADDLIYLLFQNDSLTTMVLVYYCINLIYNETQDKTLLKATRYLEKEYKDINIDLSIKVNKNDVINSIVRGLDDVKELSKEGNSKNAREEQAKLRIIEQLKNSESNWDLSELKKYEDVYKYSDDKKEIKAVKINEMLDYYIPNGIVNILGNSFDKCTNMESITIPRSIIFIGTRLFAKCLKLKNVFYNGTLADWCNISFTTYNSNPMIFASNFYILDSKGKFSHGGKKYSLLSEFIVPEGIKRLGKAQLRGLKTVDKIVLPESLEEIGSGAFYKSNFNSIVIPNNVTTVGRYALAECNYLKDIVIPNSVKVFEFGAFSECLGLKNVYYNGSLEDWLLIFFRNDGANPLKYAKNLYVLDDEGDKIYNGRRYKLAIKL